jgi:NAD(P)-dependent dehydrogenase (short-subunit alcohol dehydrogenase family)
MTSGSRLLAQSENAVRRQVDGYVCPDATAIGRDTLAIGHLTEPGSRKAELMQKKGADFQYKALFDDEAPPLDYSVALMGQRCTACDNWLFIIPKDLLVEDFKDAVAVITGGASGIGFALAIEITARGGAVAIADISAEEAEAAARQVGANARAYQCDVTDQPSVGKLANNVLRDFGKVTHVFANAGVAIAGKLHETAEPEFDWLVDVNIRGPFNTVRAFTPALIEAAKTGSRARLIFTGSENSVGLPSTGIMTANTATKHAMLAFADGCRRDLEGDGVAVSIFCPGLVATKIYDSRRARPDRYGGNAPLEAAAAENMAAMVAQMGQPAEMTARICLDGIGKGEFLIITDSKIRDFAQKRHAEVERALDRLDAELPSFVS